MSTNHAVVIFSFSLSVGCAYHNENVVCFDGPEIRFENYQLPYDLVKINRSESDGVISYEMLLDPVIDGKKLKSVSLSLGKILPPDLGTNLEIQENFDVEGRSYIFFFVAPQYEDQITVHADYEVYGRYEGCPKESVLEVHHYEIEHTHNKRL